MEVRLDKRYPIAATIDQAWTVLADIRATAACMPGAQITDQLDATHYKGTVKSKIGPATMSFAGDIEVLALEPSRRELRMLGKGADKSGSSASMDLKAHLEPGESAADCVLVGQATVTVSGKLAQFGSRLLVPVSDAMLAQFADNFRAASAMQLGAETAAAPSGLTSTAAVTGTVAATTGEAAFTTAGAMTGAEAPAVVQGLPRPAPARPVVVAPPVKELNALGLMWTVIKGWFAGLFGRKA
jgi:uncharacterized protein